jgi:hypothetical protein
LGILAISGVSSDAIIDGFASSFTEVGAGDAAASGTNRPDALGCSWSGTKGIIAKSL